MYCCVMLNVSMMRVHHFKMLNLLINLMAECLYHIILIQQSLKCVEHNFILCEAESTGMNFPTRRMNKAVLAEQSRPGHQSWWVSTATYFVLTCIKVNTTKQLYLISL